MSSGWFDCTEPSALAQGGSSTSNHFITEIGKVWRVLTHVFGVVRPYRNFSSNSVKGETRCARCSRHCLVTSSDHVVTGWPPTGLATLLLNSTTFVCECVRGPCQY